MTPRSDVATFSNTKCDVVFEFVIFYLFNFYDAAYSKYIMLYIERIFKCCVLIMAFIKNNYMS